MDSIVASPGLRLDLNDGVVWTLHSDTTFGMPSLNRAIVSTLLADGAQVPAAAYGLRLLTIVASINVATEDLAADELQRLFVELERPTNILQWQPVVTNPVFFRALRSSATNVTWDPTLKRVTVEILAEPFAIGLEESWGTLTLSRSTVVSAADITGIKGDVETPLVMSTDRSFAGGFSARQTVFGVKRRAGAMTFTGLLEAETLTMFSGDASTQTVAGYSGGTPNCARITFASSATLTPRLTGDTPFSGAEMRGTYRVFARVKKSVAGDPIQVELHWGAVGSSAASVNQQVVLPATTNIVMIDLGLVSIPYGADPLVNGYSGVEVSPTAANVGLEFWAGRTSGTSNLEVDCLIFVPADDEFAIVGFPSNAGLSGYGLVWDGPNQTIYKSTSGFAGGGLQPSILASIVGTPALMVSPGVTNRVVSIYDVTPGVATTIPASTNATYVVTYYPRYLYVRPVLT